MYRRFWWARYPTSPDYKSLTKHPGLLSYHVREYVMKREWKEVIPLKLLSPDKPVSGSLAYEDMPKARKFEWDVTSLNCRGFLRFQKEYMAPDDAKEAVLSVAKSMISELREAGEEDIMKFKLTDVRVKFEFLISCFDKFQHGIPNSMLYLMNTVEDVANFYSSSIKTVTPYDELTREKDALPPNLHVQKEPVRFHPDTDTVFGGITAFPKSSTIVTGLRAKKKYKGYEAKKSWY